MSFHPVSAQPGSPDVERRRARIVVILVTVGIAASLLAYAISPAVRHAVRHAAHSVGRVLDKDKTSHKALPAPTPGAGHGATTQAAPPLAPGHGTTTGSGATGGTPPSTAPG